MAYMANRYEEMPATYKDTSENYKSGLDEAAARAENTAMKYGYASYNPLANNPRGSEEELLEAERVKAENKLRRDNELAEKIEKDETLTDEEIEYIYTNIMYGTLGANKLSSYINVLVKNNKDDMIKDIIENQAKLSVEQMKEAKEGYNNLSVDRQFQFMQTLATLKENNYYLNGITFENKEGKKTDFIKFMADYSEKCMENKATMSEQLNSPVIDQRISYSPQLISSLFVEEEFVKNPNRFENEYQEYLITKKDSKFKLTYDEFMRNRYNITINRLEEKLKMFEESRKKVMLEDQKRRNEMLKSNTNTNTEEVLAEQVKIFEDVSSNGRGM